MCVPKPETPALPPSNAPSLAAATDLQLGGIPRGAAQLGRQALRIPTAKDAPAPKKANPTATTQEPALSPALGFTGVFQNSPNSDLRIPT